MNDFVSGALRLSSMKNGMPVFVKHGRVHDRESRRSPEHHADVEAIALPEDEEKIFVSLDKIREEIHALKEHDDYVSKQAEQLQQEVDELHAQVAKHKSRKDSAMGSDSESSMVDHLNAQKSRKSTQFSSQMSWLTHI
jgi:predicted RNase H-like nuclease (RuvC/YqgF family)